MNGRLSVAVDPHGIVTLMDLELRNAGFLEEFDEFLDFSYIHIDSPLVLAPFDIGHRGLKGEFIALCSQP